MIKQILSIGIIGSVLVNDVTGSEYREDKSLMVYDDTTGSIDYVEQNRDDLGQETGTRQRIVGPTNGYYDSNELPVVNENENSNENDKHNTEFHRDITKKPNDRVNKEDKREIVCRYLMCKKIDEAVQNAHREIEKEVEKLVDAGKSITEAKNNIFLSLSKAGFEFVREMMKKVDKS